MHRIPVIHDLKILPEFFQAVVDGSKTAEFRIFDRDFSVGDLLCLCEWSAGSYTGQSLWVLITHVLPVEHLCVDRWAVLSFECIKPFNPVVFVGGI